MDTTADGSLLESVSRRLQGIIFVLALFFAIGRLREYWRLRHFPGPSTTGFSWLWHSRAVIGGESPKYYGDICEQYGRQSTWLARLAGTAVLIFL